MARSQALHELNHTLLLAYVRQGDPEARNRLVVLNLPLVRKVAHQESQRTDLPFEDLVQQGCLGLIRAVEAFDPARQTALSSFAVPYIRGSIRHYLRDRHPALRCPRRLRDLHARGQALQQQRLHRGDPPLGEAELAEALGCSAALWREAVAVHRALQVRSLDAPVGGEGSGGGGGDPGLLTRLDQLAQPGDGEAQPLEDDDNGRPLSPSQTAMRERMASLDPLLRQLLEGRLLYEASWQELGDTLGLHARMARRRFETLMEELHQELRPVRP
ncbi:sigma-70 family RNA polymerase sigma factor [Cyanobium sp. Morenito 9A2]|uniref:sigma-70 family RNA polymerase sigma factor n=1 Tax=Cyanobium sp. Morenito 9A2 TaxID=2823718 RepID=UPI0020CDAC99|nr:sigma-70 family RNA polymerase sigma factor [Cyanobium sp. Morenito 9A2]MCP9848723.1 sigma-70 family RNA polymerase sigma factor [Cyanobium sp. Morenito 9A2]